MVIRWADVSATTVNLRYHHNQNKQHEHDKGHNIPEILFLFRLCRKFAFGGSNNVIQAVINALSILLVTEIRANLVANNL